MKAKSVSKRQLVQGRHQGDGKRGRKTTALTLAAVALTNVLPEAYAGSLVNSKPSSIDSNCDAGSATGTIHSYQKAGQAIYLKGKNKNVVGLVIDFTIDYPYDDSVRAVLLPNMTRYGKFTIFGEVPIAWGAHWYPKSDAVFYEWAFWSTQCNGGWSPGGK